MDYSEKKVLIMGLGLHGGGLESARFMLKRGAKITVTDLREEAVLKPSIEKLDIIASEFGHPPVRYVIGRHETDDFADADIVIKNPGVRPDSPFLQKAKKIETDISLFLSESPARLFAVTGTKGKSVTAAALHWIIKNSYLGGNITVSPLTFLDDLTSNDNVVLELSSFQLGDLKGRTFADGSPLLKPAAAILTAIMEDHLDRYSSMEEYIDDKRYIYRGQDSNCVTVAGNDDWGRSFLAETKARPVMYSLKDIKKEHIDLLPEKLLVTGEHQKINLLAAGLAAYECGIGVETVRTALSDFRGVEHRLEMFHEARGLRFYNDSAATIPEAAALCVEALCLNAPLILVTGGTDKNLDFSPLVKALVAAGAKIAAVILLAGTGSEKLTRLLAENSISFSGPFDNLDTAVQTALDKAKPGYSVALSPGCASFGMFLNEFDRGRKWKNAVLGKTG
ncbi:MAG: UDP-N-acetylmuramoyl-L-alanine--D-glutamate ligase [Treponema sp.]|jgi:UDP-N-acetylmuramoylalanine--D-glutamate ligase|nr:UDP-N-acetylmuramoyl-L-alanine--D-glutamate ligase [Treponema sp.]